MAGISGRWSVNSVRGESGSMVNHGHVPWPCAMKSHQDPGVKKSLIDFSDIFLLAIFSYWHYFIIWHELAWYNDVYVVQILTDSVRSLKCQVPRAGVKSLPCTGRKTLTLQGGCKAQLIFGHEPWPWDVTQFTHVSSWKSYIHTQSYTCIHIYIYNMFYI